MRLRTFIKNAAVGLGMVVLSISSTEAATYCVNSTAETGGSPGDCVADAACAGAGTCDIRDAIAAADSDEPSDDIIIFDPTVFPPGGGTTISTTSVLTLSSAVAIVGPGVDSLTISNDGSSRVFEIDHSGFLSNVGPHEISGMTITGGDGGIDVDHVETDVTLDSLFITVNNTSNDAGGSPDGGGIWIEGFIFTSVVTISNCRISNNIAEGDGGGIAVDSIQGNSSVVIENSTIAQNSASFSGGGIFNAGGSSLTIENSTIYFNSTNPANDRNGGGIQNEGAGSSVQVTNSTITGNFSDTDGGGINNEGGGTSNTVDLLNVTIFDNTADETGGGLGDGGGISQGLGAGAFTITNTIVAGNHDNTNPGEPNDCNTDGTNVVSGGNNLIGDDTGCADETFDASLNDQVGNGGLPIIPLLAALDPSDGGNPALGELTGIHSPLLGSPSIDAVDETIASAPPADQHGTLRLGAAPEIGAVEVGCGNSLVDLDEDCDDGAETSTCDADCTAPVCGDDHLNTLAGEACDDGGDSATCNADCTIKTCGNGLVEAPEACDGDGAGAGGETATCNANCTTTACGDTILNVTAGEVCEDGNTVDGDGCSSTCQFDGGPDGDSDLVPDPTDNCPSDANTDQADANGDGEGDACDSDSDTDGDGVADADDNCIGEPNADQADADEDGEGNACDFDSDTDGDGTPDVADTDDDEDGIDDTDDNCSLVANDDQTDTDEDGVGDDCDDDDDADGIADADDNCPLDDNADQEDTDEDGIGDACEEGGGCSLIR